MAAAAARAAVGEAAWDGLLSALSPAARNLLVAPQPTDVWLDAGVVGECLGRFSEAGPLGTVPAVLGAESMRARQPEAYRSPADLIEALPRIWNGALEGGSLEITRIGPTRVAIRLWAHWPVPYFFDTHLPAWLSHSLLLAGAARPVVRHCPPTAPDLHLHGYEATWVEAI